MVPPFPRWRWIQPTPQSIAMPFGLGLGVFVIGALLARLFLGVLLVPPGHPGLDLFQADILATDENDTHLAPVAVDFAAMRFSGTVVMPSPPPAVSPNKSPSQLSPHDKICSEFVKSKGIRD